MQTFFFIAFPYIALILAVGIGLYRYFSHRFTYSSLSSQLLENRHLFWGSVSWHYGITLILAAHILPWLFLFQSHYSAPFRWAQETKVSKRSSRTISLPSS